MGGHTDGPEVVMQARSQDFGEWVQECANGDLKFAELCKRVAARGYSTNSLYEVVMATRPTKATGAA